MFLTRLASVHMLRSALLLGLTMTLSIANGDEAKVEGEDALRGPLTFSRNSPLMKGFTDADRPMRLVYTLGRSLRDFYKLENTVNRTVRLRVHSPGFVRPPSVQGYAGLAKAAHSAAAREATPALTEFESEYLLALSVAEVVRHTYRIHPLYQHWGGGHLRFGESTGTFEAEFAEMLRIQPPYTTSDAGITFLYQGIGEAVGLTVEGVVGTAPVWKGYGRIPARAMGGFFMAGRWTINVVRFKGGQIGLLNIGIAMVATELWGGGNASLEIFRPFGDVILPKVKFEVERFYSLFTDDPAVGASVTGIKKLNFRPYQAPKDLGCSAYSIFEPAENEARMRIDRQIDAYLAIDRRLRG